MLPAEHALPATLSLSTVEKPAAELSFVHVEIECCCLRLDFLRFSWNSVTSQRLPDYTSTVCVQWGEQNPTITFWLTSLPACWFHQVGRPHVVAIDWTEFLCGNTQACINIIADSVVILFKIPYDQVLLSWCVTQVAQWVSNRGDLQSRDWSQRFFILCNSTLVQLHPAAHPPTSLSAAVNLLCSIKMYSV